MKHLYGIVPTSSEIGAVLSLRRPEPVEGSKGVGPDIVGVHGFPVHTLTHNGVTAIVSDSRYDDYSRLSKPALVQVLADHQRVTETLMPHTSVLLPVKFGTLLPDKGVHALLAQSSGDFEAAFQTLTGKVEVEVVATWQPGRVLAEIAQEPTVVQLRAAAVGRSSAEVQRIQIVLGQIVMAGLEERKAAYQKQILDSLRDMVDDMEINLALNEQVVANLAFLLPSAKQAEFDQRIEALDARLHGQLDFKIVGPLPAHSFSTVEVLKINAEDVAWAQELLEIGDRATADEIRTAFLRKARLHHPDATQDNPMAAEQFADINQANQLLRHCHAVQYQAIGLFAGNGAGVDLPESEFRCDFSPAAVSGALLVNLCRSSELTS
jgi:hypothetical protein